ncbi:MAG: patatin-like phospholipase family protein, partial [Desulfobacterales bacterium]
MNLERTGLVLEGGGLRGVYTSGVLRYFMDRGLFFPYVVGVSMGACNGANYISRQPERNRIVNIRYVNDRRYLSWARWLAG